MAEPRPYWVAGNTATGARTITVTHPWDGDEVDRVAVAEPEHIEQAITAAEVCSAPFAHAPAHVRADALAHVALRLAERREEMARTIVAEAGKPLKWARSEVDRASSTFRWGAEEARRWSGELQRLDSDPSGDQRTALVRRVPRGPVLAISPSNFPLNLVAHKVAPALAVGAPVLVKPAPATPGSALLLGEILAETGLPDGSWSVLPVPDEAMQPLVADPRLPVISFTGSGPVGWSIRDAVPRKHVTLELGGNAAVVVCADTDTEEALDHAANRVAVFGTYQAGQSCVSVQRVLVHESLRDTFEKKLAARFEQLVTGDPFDEATDVGPQINHQAAIRIEQWIAQSLAAGARLVTGGTRQDASLSPALLADVNPDQPIWCEEVFGPIVALASFRDTDEAFAMVNDSRYGLQAGVFTRDLATAFEASRVLEVGGVVIGDVPSYRADQMPYGGVKESGTGREGVRASMTDMTEEKVLVLTGVHP